MRIANLPCDIGITSIDKDNNIINQKAVDIQQHEVNKIFRVLSKNDRNWSKDTLFSPGYFNNKTNFLLGNQNSIVVFDSNINMLCTPDNDIENIVNREDLFILYPVPCFNMLQNEEIIYNDMYDDKDVRITLDAELGIKFGEFLANNSDEKMIHKNKNFLKLVIDKKNGLSLNKNFIINSNPDFVLGILNGYYNSNKSADNTFIINSNVNIYLFTNILNYLGASYSIRKKDDKLKLVFQLPYVFEDRIDSLFIKKEIYIEHDNKILLSNIDTLKNINNSGLSVNNKLGLSNCQNILIPVNSLLFQELTLDEKNKTSKILYDFSTENHEATNYALPFTPYLKNSDGDILTLTGIFLKGANESAKKYSPENKDYYKDLNSGDIINWIADDAILGLYASTK